MKHLLIAVSTLAFLAGAPLAAQAATSSTTHPKHSTVRHHTASKKSHMNQAKNKVSCPAGSTNPACHPSSTGSVR
ncbi:hypothetical protein [Microvirga mediterraneensis]|uniref:Uncharacterized protein n=1 Tax=Microvirga mediterraneensis TaxID=2754695 RepID=A0A838BLK3_9HYPH|nr:hypothetical protein [Microvirga mediterraneensis]MBA1156348.1 hypothetical protein [Microvirga mediterraneensis]